MSYDDEPLTFDGLFRVRLMTLRNFMKSQNYTFSETSGTFIMVWKSIVSF